MGAPRIFVFNSFMQILLYTLVLMLTACSNKKTIYIANPHEKLPIRVEGSYDAAQVALQIQLRKECVDVITIGQDYLISIPSSVLFAEQTTRLTQKSYMVLNDVIRFMKLFRKVAVHITAYTTPYISKKRDEALAKKRARAVMNYFWTQDIGTRFIFTDGAGSDKPIVNRLFIKDASPNSRVEITFRDAIV